MQSEFSQNHLLSHKANKTVIRFGFGSNIWDITPQEDITLIYKVRPLVTRAYVLILTEAVVSRSGRDV